MTLAEFNSISEKAEKQFSIFKRAPGARGQAVTEKDGPEYWYALVAYEYGFEKGRQS